MKYDLANHDEETYSRTSHGAFYSTHRVVTIRFKQKSCGPHNNLAGGDSCQTNEKDHQVLDMEEVWQPFSGDSLPDLQLALGTFVTHESSQHNDFKAALDLFALLHSF